MELKTFFAQDDAGNILGEATCYLYERGTESLVNGLWNSHGLVLGNPFISGKDGLIQFATANGIYDLRVVKNARDYRISVQCNDVTETAAAAEGAARALEEKLSDPALGTVKVAHKSKLPGSVGRTSQTAIDEMFVSICGFGASVTNNDNSPFIRKAWLEAPEGSTLLIPAAEFRIGSPLRLPTRNVNIRCDGSILVGAGSWDGVVFDGLPDVTLPGTALSAVKKDGMRLNFMGVPPVNDPHNYFFDIETKESYVSRVTQYDYTDYTKNEAHAIVSYDWQISDPFIYTHNDLSKATLHLTKKNKATVIDRLRIVAEADTSTTYRNLLRNRSQSNMTFVDLELDSTLSNRFGIGLGTSKCFNIRYIRPKINGYNISGVQGDISYPSAGHLSSYVYYNGYVLDQTVEDPDGDKRPRGSIDHYCNQVFYDDCNLTGGVDAHIGSNYYVRDSILTQEGFSFVGTNVTMERVKGHGTSGNMALFAVRGDAPYCHGKLTIKDCEMPGEWLAVYLTTSTISDPLGRTSKFKMFDEIDIDGITITGAGLQTFNSVFNFSGVRNFTVFPVNEKTSRISIKNIRAENSFMTDISQSFMRIGDADVVVQGTPSLNVGEFIIDDLHLPKTGRHASTYVGDLRFGPCAIDKMIIKNSTGLSMYRIRGMSALGIDRCKTNTKAEFYFEKFNDIAVTIESSELNIPINVAAINPLGAPTFTLLDNVFNAIGQVQNGKIIRSQGNVVGAGLTIPPFYTGKVTNYMDATVYKTA